VPEFLESDHVFAGVFILATLAILLMFDFRGLCWPKAPRPTARHADPHDAPVLPNTPHHTRGPRRAQGSWATMRKRSHAA
jgi:hypothetical protein